MTRLASLVLDWYSRHGRDLPWRKLRDPYAIWISEVMLQQTRVEAVLPYFERWMESLPSMQALAGASEHVVLKHWEGLGYYNRARSLRRAAQMIVRDHNGEIPTDAVALRRLPGVGEYTAAAVASIAFGKDEPALDGNIRRVLARVFNVRAPIGSPAAQRRIRDLALQNLPRGRAADFNQALMDLGAMICVAGNPRCTSCPVRGMCAAYRLGRQATLPVRAGRKRPRRIHMAALVILDQGKVLLHRRPSHGLLGGMWEFPKVELDGKLIRPLQIQRKLPAVIRSAMGLQVECLKHFIQVSHAYSHFAVLVEAFRCVVASRSVPAGYRWASFKRLSGYPMGKVDRKIANRLREDRSKAGGRAGATAQGA